ncbi:heterokaryon incompatibility protein-domain-containing protein [Ilyonectria destructans]|nr:heterokaryon incompatibility protein-domain-containing protein [Ilyonectria destructans]
MKFLQLVTFCGLASSAIIRPFNLISDTVAQDGKLGNLSAVDYIPSPSQPLPRKLDADEGELSEGEKIQAFKAAKQAAGRRSLEVGKHYYFMNCYKAGADYVPNTNAGKWAAGEYKKLIQQEKKKNIHGCTHVGLVLGRVDKVAKGSSGCTGWCETVRTFDGTFRDVKLNDYGEVGAYWHVREKRYASREGQELFYGGQIDLTRYDNNITALNVDLDIAGKKWLSEFVVVIVVWACALLLPLRLIIRVQETLPEIWRDPSVELQIFASSMSIMLDLYVPRMLTEVCWGMGFRAEDSRTWLDSLQAALTMQAPSFYRSPGMGARWMRHRIMEILLRYWIDPRRVPPVRLNPPRREPAAIQNCVAALRNIHEDRRERRMWVDAICIDQASTEEKIQQIGIMGDIYKTAASVRVWLGEQDDSSSLVCEYFAKVSGIDDGQAIRDTEHEATKIGLDMARKWPQLSKSLADFFGRSWFTRAWPVQEITLPYPGRVIVVCGDVHLKLEYIRRGWDVLRKLGVLPASVNVDQAIALQFYLADAIALKRGVNPTRHDNDLGFGESRLKGISQFSYTSVMNYMRFKACRDPKDRFFSLYGVFQELEIDHDIPISMWAQTDAQVFKAVALACFKLDGNLDAIRLAQIPDPYLRLSYSLLLPARRNPYDGISASMFTMTSRVLRVATNVRAGRDACYAPATDWLIDLPSWVPDWTQPISTRVDPARHISLLDTFMPALSLSSPEEVCYDIDGPCLKVEAKIVGRVTEIGTVDSVQLLWQVLASIIYPRTGRRNTTPDPVMSALTETAINLVWRSHIAQVFVSMRMAVRTLDLFDILAYITAAYSSGYFRIRIHQLLCMRFPSVASCPTDGHRMQLDPRWKRQSLTEISAINQAFAVFLKGRTWINRDMWRQSSGDILFTIGGVFWEFRVSLTETLFRTRYDDMEWTFVLPVLGHLISAAIQFAAVFIGDTTIFLIAWSLGALANIGFMIAFVVWAWRILVLPVVVVVALRVYRSPVQFLSSLFG